MTEQLTSPSNSSIDENILRLNSSSSCFVSPSQSGFGSSLKDNLVHFEQYKCSPQPPCLQINPRKQPGPVVAGLGLGKKKLTIKIDQNYDQESNNQSIRYEKYEKQERPQKPKMKLSHILQSESDQSSRQIDHLEVISPIESKNMAKYYELQAAMKELERNYESAQTMLQMKDEKLASTEQKVSVLQVQLQQKTAESEFKSSRITFLEEKLRQKDEELQQLSEQFSPQVIGEIQQKMKEKDSKIRELAKINQKLKNLNKDLIKQVKISDKKVRDLQKQIQSNVCIAAQQNIHRLKQSSLKLKQKQNYERYNGSSHTNPHTKTERGSLHTFHNLNTTKDKEKEVSFAATNNSNHGRKSLERKKKDNGNTTSAGQLSQPKKAAHRIGSSSSSNTILSKKLMHKCQ